MSSTTSEDTPSPGWGSDSVGDGTKRICFPDGVFVGLGDGKATIYIISLTRVMKQGSDMNVVGVQVAFFARLRLRSSM